MKTVSLLTVCLSVLASSVVADNSCTRETALVFDPSAHGGFPAGDSCTRDCDGDGTCLKACQSIVDQLSSTPSHSHSHVRDTDTISAYTRAFARYARRYGRRKLSALGSSQRFRKSDEPFVCSEESMCFINPENKLLFCRDESSGDFVDEFGGQGNTNTGLVEAQPGVDLYDAEGQQKPIHGMHAVLKGLAPFPA